VEIRPRIEPDGEFLAASDKIDRGLVVVPERASQKAEAFAVMDRNNVRALSPLTRARTPTG
jgi:hypothetical protein